MLATIDYVDSWYECSAMTDYPKKSADLESIAVSYRDFLDGIVLFANDQDGNPVPRGIIESIAQRYWAPRTVPGWLHPLPQ